MINYESMSKLLHFLKWKNFQKPINQTHLVGKWYLACMIWLSTKPNLWCQVHLFFLVMKLQILINSPRFPFMFVWWKINSGHLCCYPCNMWLMGPFTMKNCIHRNHITLQLKFKTKFIYNYYVVIFWVLQLICNYPFRNMMYL